MKLVYNVYDDDNQIESKQFDNFPEALAYAKHGLITFICEEDLDCPDCEEKVVWTWDSTWDDEEAIANVESNGEKSTDEEVEPEDTIEINISGPAEDVKSLVELMFDDAFDIDWDEPNPEPMPEIGPNPEPCVGPECEAQAEVQNFDTDFGYEEEPIVKDFDFNVDNPFDDDLYYADEDEENFEVGEPEIVVDLQDSKEDQEDKKLELGKPFEDPKADSDEEKEEVLIESTDEVEDFLDEFEDEEELEGDEEFDEEILLNLDGVKEIAAEAGEEVAEVVKENPEVEAEEIKEITDAVVDNAIEEMEEVSEEEFEEVEENEDDLKEETHAQYAKPEGNKVQAYNNALKYAKQYNKPFIYGYSQIGDGKFFALEQPIKVSGEIRDAEKDFRNRYKRCSTVYVVYPDKSFLKESNEISELTSTQLEEAKCTDCGGELKDNKCTACNRDFNLAKCKYCGGEVKDCKCRHCDAKVDTVKCQSCGGEVVDNKCTSCNEIFEESIPMTKDELLDKHGTTDVDLINAGRPEEERVELVELEESISQELAAAYKEISRIYGKDLNELLWGPEGFMTLNYPNGFEDFKGDIIYSEKYWTEFEKWLEDNNKLNESNIEDQEDDLTDEEFAEQLQERLSEIKK